MTLRQVSSSCREYLELEIKYCRRYTWQLEALRKDDLHDDDNNNIFNHLERARNIAGLLLEQQGREKRKKSS